MMLSDKFAQQPWFHRLGKRAHTFSRMISHLEKSAQDPSNVIIETGCARIEDNWEGDGQSTLIWDWVIGEYDLQGKNLRAFSIDISEEALRVAKQKTQRVEFLHGDSVQVLSAAANGTSSHQSSPSGILFSEERIKCAKLLYLDSFDWSLEANLDSSFHHFCELAAVWPLLPRGCMIVVDDRHGPGLGKHVMVEFFMEKLGIRPEFAEYQIGWLKN